MWKEFREFIARGNVFDLAVGIVIGAAFTAVVNSFVNDLLMPIIGFILGGADFSNYFIVLKGPEGVTFATLAAAQGCRRRLDQLGPVSERPHQLPDRGGWCSSS